MALLKALSVLLIPLLCTAGPLVGGLPSVPESRQQEIQKIVLDLQNPAVIVFVAIRPGAEDFAALASLRLGQGAKVTTVFVTNGESVPNDAAGESQRLTAGRRKEEAYACATLLGTQAYFLNMTDPGVLNNPQDIQKVWNKDTLASRLSSILEAIHPDFIFLTGDLLLGNSSSASMRILRETLITVIEKRPAGSNASKGAAHVSGDQRKARVFADEGGATQKFRFEGSLKPKGSDRTAAQIGVDAIKRYQSYQAIWPYLTNAARGYSLLYPRLTRLPASFNSGVAVVPSALKSLSEEITTFTRGLGGRASDTMLIRLDALIGTTDAAIRNMGGKLPAHDQGIIARWKNGLEELRCTLLGVRCDFTLSDSLVTENQLFLLKINSIKPSPKAGSTNIYVPKSSNIEWIVNESLQKSFPYDGPAEFRILTPGQLAKNTPASSHGLTASRMRTNFLFLIVHQDSVRSRNFIYRKEIPMKIGPIQSFELDNETVVASPFDPLAFRIQNISRDAVSVPMAVRDSVVRGGPKTLLVQGRTEVSDTLGLHWTEGLLPGDHPTGIWTVRKELARFTGRKFACDVSGPDTVAIISSIARSSLERAVRSLGKTPRVLTPSAVSESGLSGLHIAIVDRDAFAVGSDLSVLERNLWQWVNEGGRLVLLPQFQAESPPFTHRQIPRFVRGLAMQPGAEVLVDTAHTLAYIPNRLNPDDWKGWVFSTAFGSLDVSGTSSEILLRAKDSRMPLLTSSGVGKGSILCVALNMDAQWSSVVPGVYRLLANILASK